MQFKPMTQSEIDSFENNSFLIEPGIYEFYVQDAIDKFSQAGNPMIELELYVETKRGPIKVKDFVTYTEKAPWLIGNFCKSIGHADKLKLGALAMRDVINSRGMLEIEHNVIEKHDPNDANKLIKKTYNKVKRYITQQEGDHLKKVVQEDKMFNGDISF